MRSRNPTAHGWKSNGREIRLENGSRVAVIGGGPAGSLFSYFLLDMAERVDLDVRLDIYERRDFSRSGPAGCNMCGGVVSESMVQTLAAQGINLPHAVVQRGIDSYVMHMDEGHLRIETPLQERRIAAVYRGAGPRGMKKANWRSFDEYLLELAVDKGAHLLREKVESAAWTEGRPQIKTRSGRSETYDLLAAATGVNTTTLKLFEGLALRYRQPRTTKTYISEFCLGEEVVKKHLGSSMHVFLLKIPRLEFAAIIPKGDYVTVCLLGHEIDMALVNSFLENPEVKQCFPSDHHVLECCHCSPRINVRGGLQPFADRLVFVGDCGVTRLYKDGIGAAYRTARAAARTAVFEGISEGDFRRYYRPACRAISIDNSIGGLIFAFTRLIQKMRWARRGILRMVSKEQQTNVSHRRMSTVLWDTFSGSAPYRSIFLRTLHPAFLFRLFWNISAAIWSPTAGLKLQKSATETVGLGRVYQNGEAILREGEEGNCMYVIQAGRVEVIQKNGDQEVRLAVLEEGDFFGEMALFEREVRSATVSALGEARVLTVDKKAFLHRVQEDPSLAFRIVQNMSQRIRKMNAELTQIKSQSVCEKTPRSP